MVFPWVLKGLFIGAFALFKRDEVDAVRETYPECASFVEENRLLLYREVKYYLYAPHDN